MTDTASLAAAPPREGAMFRAALGLVALVGGLIGMGGLYFVPIPTGNREPLLRARSRARLGLDRDRLRIRLIPRRPKSGGCRYQNV